MLCFFCFFVPQDFLEYHGQKKWASASRIRRMLTDLGISKTGNDPIKQDHFARRDIKYISLFEMTDFSLSVATFEIF